MLRKDIYTPLAVNQAEWVDMFVHCPSSFNTSTWIIHYIEMLTGCAHQIRPSASHQALHGPEIASSCIDVLDSKHMHAVMRTAVPASQRHIHCTGSAAFKVSERIVDWIAVGPE